MQDLSGRIAVVTGASGTIGSAVALRLAQAGMNIVLCGRDSARLEAVAEKTGRKQDMLVFAGDLTEEECIRECIEKTCSRFGGIDVLVNNAGIALHRSFDETDAEDLDRIYAINVRAPFLLTRAALPALRRSDCAAVVNMCSAVAHHGYVNQSAYSMSKHALLGMTKALAREVQADGIRVHAVSPGGVEGDMIRAVRPELGDSGMISPAEVAEAVHVLLSFRGNAVIDEIILHRAGKEPFA